MNLKSLILASSVVFTFVGAANAADAIIAEEPIAVAAPVFSWSGAYLGGQIGYGWGKSKWSAYDADEDEGDSINFKPNGFLGGLYAGYNFDIGNNVILGVDGDVTYNALKKSYSETDEDFGLTAKVESKLRWSGAVRARAGYTVDRFMPYIAGGVAFGSVKNSISLSAGEDSIGVSQSKTLTGWTLGGGVDYAATDNVIIRFEYRYTDYGSKNFGGGDEDLGFGAKNKFKTNDIRLGVAYKF